MERFPVDVPLYAATMDRAEWKRLASQLAYQRKKGNAGEHGLVPTGYGMVLVVSDAVIGDPITLAAVEDAMYDSRSEWGKMTFSEAWRGEVTPVEHTPGFVDDGPVTSSLEWIEHQAQRIGLNPVERSTSISYRTTPEEHEALYQIAGVGAVWVPPVSRVEAPHPWKRRVS
jgi:hypothetical protein